MKLTSLVTSSQPGVDRADFPNSAECLTTNLSKSAGSETSLDPHVSCSVYGESTNVFPKDEDLAQTRFLKPPFEDLDFILVGLGEKGINCGIIFATHLCRNMGCMKVHYTKQRCMRRACPNCYEKWLEEETENITARLLSKEAKKRNYGKRLVRIIVSPDPKKAPICRGEFDRLIKEGYEYIKEKGVRGGCEIIHPFRATQEAKIISIEADVKTWEWIREQKDPESWFYYSLHFHLLAYVDHLEEPEEGEEWVYKTGVDEKGHVIDFLREENREGLKKVIRYFLSHTGTVRKEEGKFHSVRWFGTCSYNKFKTTEEEMEVREKEEKKDLKCKICGRELMPFWAWVKRSYGDVVRDIRNNVLDPPRFWEEVQNTVEKEDPPEDAENYLI